MRRARANSFWEKSYKRNYDKSIDFICLNGHNNIPNINFGGGINAICGLNGAGKSTIFLGLKHILGLSLLDTEKKKHINPELYALISSAAEQKRYSTQDAIKFSNLPEFHNKINLVDHNNSTKTISFLNQDNLDELLEQFEKIELVDDMVKELNYIIGKTYDKIFLINIEDEDGTSIPYFKVEIGNVTYDSVSMGSGEHSLFYLWWAFYQIDDNCIILLEEPETFISIRSQEKLMNFIAMKSVSKGITVLLTTHSPFIIKNIKRENINIITRFGDNVDIYKPDICANILSDLGLEGKKSGTIFVEDNKARLFLIEILKRYSRQIFERFNIEFVHGEGPLSERLNFPYSEYIDYKFIGIYDGDMVTKKPPCDLSAKGWHYTFLPTVLSIEEEFRSVLINNIDYFAHILGKSRSELVRILAKIDGEDHHDWFTAFSTHTISIESLTEKIFSKWIEEGKRQEIVDRFITELNIMCQLD